VLDGVLWALCEDLLARGALGLDETFIDASFAGAKMLTTFVYNKVLKARNKAAVIAEAAASGKD
jgi:hypothetical protein